MTTGKTIALTIWTFVDIVMSLLFAGGRLNQKDLDPHLCFLIHCLGLS